MKTDVKDAIILDGIAYTPDKSQSHSGTQCKRCDLAKICGCGDEYYCNLFGGYPLRRVSAQSIWLQTSK